MLKEDLWRKLNDDVKKENISSIHSFKKRLNNTESEDIVPLSQAEEQKVDESISIEMNNGDEKTAQGYDEDSVVDNTIGIIDVDNECGQVIDGNEESSFILEEDNNSQVNKLSDTKILDSEFKERDSVTESFEVRNINLNTADEHCETENAKRMQDINIASNEDKEDTVSNTQEDIEKTQINDNYIVQSNIKPKPQRFIDDNVFNSFFNITGRIGRKVFTMRFFAICIAVGIVIQPIVGRGMSDLLAALLSIPLQIRRLHDLDKPVWLILLSFIVVSDRGQVAPLGMAILLILLCFIKGTDGLNKYGPDPLQDNESIDKTEAPSNNEQSEMQKTTAQTVDNLKERTLSATTVVGGTVSSILQTVSEKSTKATEKANDMVKAVSEKAPEIGNNISGMTQKVKEKAVEMSSNSSDNKTESVDNKNEEVTKDVHFCPKCGEEILIDSKFCGNCGNPVENDLMENGSVQNVSAPIYQEKTTDGTQLLDSFNQDQSADAKKKKLIAMIVAAIIILGLGGYFLLGRSSDSKDMATKPAAGQTNQVNTTDFNQKAKPVEKPTPPPPSAVRQDTARNAFISFHTAITNRQLAEAYNILSPDYQKFVRSYDNFARGYATTLRSDVVELNTINEDNNFAVLTYKLKAEDQVDGGKATQYFVGKAHLIKINGQWRIDSTEAKKASQNSKVALNMVKIVAKGEVNLRANPTTNANAVGVVREGDLVELLETGTCTDSSAAIVISDDVYVSSGSKRTQLGKGMAIKIVRDTGREIICRVNIDNRPTDVRFAPNHLVKLHGTTWYKVSSNGHTGWIYSNYARKQ